jgi:Tfp pilus assembly protein PilE
LATTSLVEHVYGLYVPYVSSHSPSYTPYTREIDTRTFKAALLLTAKTLERLPVSLNGAMARNLCNHNECILLYYNTTSQLKLLT